MKITLTINFEIPDTNEVDAIIQDAAERHILMYAQTSHLQDAMRWSTQERIDAHGAEGCKILTAHHELWAEICGTATCSVKIKR